MLSGPQVTFQRELIDMNAIYYGGVGGDLATLADVIPATCKLGSND